MAQGSSRDGSRRAAPSAILGCMTEGSYDDLATDYHWLFTDEHVSGATFFTIHASALERIRPGGRVLDCACGAGFEAIALARAGYEVAASDASEGMVAVARRNLDQAGLDVAVSQLRWDELPGRFGREFDAVLCVGNSIAHCDGPAAMATSLRAMHDVLAPGGVLVLESRDWERQRSEHRRLEVRSRVAVRDGVRGFTVFVWTIPERIDEPHVAELIVLLEREFEVSHHLVELRFMAYTLEELVGHLTEAGFVAPVVTPGRPGRYVLSVVRPT